MGRTKAVPFKHKPILQQHINAGKKIQGLKGFVPARTQCCHGGAKMYVPVEVVGVNLDDGCDFSVKVRIASDHIVTVKDDLIFTIDPASFFKTALDVQQYEDYQHRLREFENAMRPFEYNDGATKTRRRQLFTTALENATKSRLAEIQNEFGDDGETKLSDLPADFLKEKYRLMMLDKFFPGYGTDFDPDDE